MKPSSKARQNPADHTTDGMVDLIHCLDTIVWEAEPDTLQFTFVSLRAEEILGYPVELWLAESNFFAKHIYEEDRDTVLASCRITTTRGMDYQFKYRAVAADGHLVWLRNTVRVVRDAKGSTRKLRGVMVDISKQHETEAQLACQVRLLAKIADAVVSTDESLILTAWNPAAEELYGWKADEVLGRPACEVLGAQFVGCDTSEGLRAFAGTGRIRCELTQQRKDGNHVHVEAQTVCLRDASDRVTGFLSVNRDITVRRRAEETIRNSAEHYRLLFESNPVPMWVSDEETLSFLAVNPAAMRAYGYSREEYLVMSLPDIRPAEEVPRLLEYLEKAPPGLNKAGVWKHKKRDGTIIHVEITFEQILWEGRPARLTLAQDVTERKRMEEALRESEDRYRDLVEHSQDLICTHDLEGRLLSFNRAAAELLGYDPAEWVGQKNIRDILAPRVRDRFEEYLATIKRDGVAKGLMLVWTRSGKERIWEYNNTVRTEGVLAPVVRGMAHDITDRKRLEYAIQESEERFRLFMDNSPVLAWIKDDCGRYIYTNRPFAAVQEGCIGKDDAEILPSGVTQQLRRHDQAVLSAWRAMEFTEQVPTRDGVLRDWWVFKFPMRDRRGQPYVGGMALDLTERKQAEEALRAAEQKYRDIFERAPVGIYRSLRDGRLLSVNPTLAAILGYDSAEELLQQNLANIYWDPTERERLIAEYEPKGFAADLEVWWKKKDRTPLCIQVTAHAIKDANGVTQYFEGFVRDVTLRKEGEEAQRVSEEKFSRIFHASPSPLVISDLPDTRILEVNETFLNLTGYAREELIGHTTVQLNLWVDPGALDEALHVFSLRGSIRNMEVKFRMRSGEVRVGLLSVEPFSFGGEVCALASVMDITERKHTQEALRLSEERFAKAFRASPDPVLISTLSEGRYVEVNDSFLGLTGFSREELIGRTSLDLKIWADPKDRARLLELLNRDGEVKDLEFKLRARSGQIRTVLESSQTIQLDGENCILTVMKDITERVALEEQLRQAQKMEAVGLLAGGIAHDFNNLLVGTMGYSQLLMQHLGPDHPEYRMAAEINRASLRARELTKHLLAFGRRQVLHPEVVDLNALVLQNEDLLQRIIGEDIHVTTRLDPQLGRVRVDPAQVTEVLLNLASNARDAMPQGGTITISTAIAELNESSVPSDPDVAPGVYVQLSVSDTGCGMDAETLSHIFEPFFTTKELGKGTGLGLPMVYGTVKQSSGQIAVKSERGRGTTFEIYLPVAKDPLPPPPAAYPESAELPFPSSATVLVVEDEEIARALTGEVLKGNAWKVLYAKDGSKALQLVREHKDSIDLVLTDVIMPEMNGPQFVQRLFRIMPNAKVMYMSGYSKDQISVRTGLPKLMPYLHKPFTPDELLQSVRKALTEKGSARRSGRTPTRRGRADRRK